MPFLFRQEPLTQTPQPHPWAPPPQFSPTKAFPELKDVDMSEVSPLRAENGKEDPTKTDGGKEKEDENTRRMAVGGLRRVYNQRTRRFYRRRREPQEEDDGPASSADESDEEGTVRPLTRTTSNHYTLNLPAHPTPQSDTPYVLLGLVVPKLPVLVDGCLHITSYLQFFFNLSLILIFLYLFVQFIITVQKDVGLRISEYSQGAYLRIIPHACGVLNS